jgi:NAD-dependent deacetylase
METLVREAAGIIYRSRLTLALTGAGVSVESGIPDFRSASGLWAKFDPAEYATIDAFRNNPEKVWNMLSAMDEIIDGAEPNQAHIGMARLEAMGCLHAIITQNVDNLHQLGGSTKVIEYHGNSSTLSCIWCGQKYKSEEKRGEIPPRCSCEKLLKPDVVFFGEAIPGYAMNESYQLAASAEALIVAGTSALVSPANSIPGIAKDNGAKIIEINKEETHLTGSVTDVFLQGGAGSIVASLVEEVEKLKGH